MPFTHYDRHSDYLIDTGPLVAFLLKTDPNHNRIRRVVAALPERAQLVTVLPCITVTTYFLGKAGGWPAQSLLRDLIALDIVHVYPMAADNVMGINRLFAIMEQFRELPCDLADAALVLAAEETGVEQMLTFDAHFYAYRTNDGLALTVSPGPQR